MSSNCRLCSRSASGQGGKQSEELVAELALALLLEELKLGGGADDESFSMVSEGDGGRCTLGATTSSESPSLCLPPRIPARAGLGFLGGGGAIRIAGLVQALAWDKDVTPLVLL
jgi:hypothetical protein